MLLGSVLLIAMSSARTSTYSHLYVLSIEKNKIGFLKYLFLNLHAFSSLVLAALMLAALVRRLLVHGLLVNLNPAELTLTSTITSLYQTLFLLSTLMLVSRYNTIVFIHDKILTLQTSTSPLCSAIPYLTATPNSEHYIV